MKRPDPNPMLAGVLVEAWAEENRQAGPKPTALGSRFRYSDAGACARMIGLSALGIPPSDEMDLPGVFATRLGTILHEMWQTELCRLFPDAQVEVKSGDGIVSGHSDAVIRLDGRVGVGELKTMAGGSFDWAVGVWRKPGRGQPARRTKVHGPKPEHVLQLGLNAEAVGADFAVLIYLCVDPLSKKAAGELGLSEHERFLAQWTFFPEEWGPLVAEEKARLDDVLVLVDDGRVPDRVHPKDGFIEDPEGTLFPCGYCRHRSTCLSLPGRGATVDDLIGGSAA